MIDCSLRLTARGAFFLFVRASQKLRGVPLPLYFERPHED